VSDLLALAAELAVGLTGFAAVAAALGKTPSHVDARLDRARLKDLVELGISTTLFALIPLVLWPEGPRPEWVWTVSGVVFLMGGIGLAAVQTRRVTALGLRQMKGYSYATSGLFSSLGYGTIVLILLGLSLPQVPLDRAYIGVLFMLLCMVGLNFVRVAASLLAQVLDDQ
jgi:hypothetical protein